MATQRLDRSIRLLQLLDHREGMSLSEIAKSLACSQRTVRRDMQLLKDNGYPVERSERGYRLSHSIDLPAPTLEMGELLVLRIFSETSPLSAHEIGRRQGQQALQKVLAAGSDTTKRRWLSLARAIHIDENAAPLICDDAPRLAGLAIALEENHPLQCRCDDDTNLSTLGPLITPQSLRGTALGWFVEGTDRDSGAPLTVKLASLPTTQPSEQNSKTSDNTTSSNAAPPPHAPADHAAKRRQADREAGT